LRCGALITRGVSADALAVLARLSTSTLRGLDGRVELARLPPRSVADDWLRAQALIPPRRGGQ
jgi:hypothetical protein